MLRFPAYGKKELADNTEVQLVTGKVGLTPKWVRLNPKLDKSGAFSDQISVNLAQG